MELASTADRKNGPGLLSSTRRTRDVGAAATSGDPYVSLILCSTPSVMETGSDLGSEPTAALERLNLTLDLEYAHVIGHSADLR